VSYLRPAGLSWLLALVACSASDAEGELACGHDGVGWFELTHVEPTEHDANLDVDTWTCSSGVRTSPDTKWMSWESFSGDLSFRLSVHIRDDETGPKAFAPYGSRLAEGEVNLSITSLLDGYRMRYHTRAESSRGELELTTNGADPGESIEGWFDDVRMAGSCSWPSGTAQPDGCAATPIDVSGRFSATFD
jgi:hypothetical protein